MPKTACAESNALVDLIAAKKASEVFFYADNAYSLNHGSLASEMPDDKLMAQLRPVLDSKQLETIEVHLTARAAAAKVMRKVRIVHREGEDAAALAALQRYAKPLGNGFYEFWDASEHTTVRAQVKGFDSCYRATNGRICGSVRVSPQGNGSSEPWSFHIENEKMVVESRPIDY
jgi:hypothetical protein